MMGRGENKGKDVQIFQISQSQAMEFRQAQTHSPSWINVLFVNLYKKIKILLKHFIFLQ